MHKISCCLHPSVGFLASSRVRKTEKALQIRNANTYFVGIWYCAILGISDKEGKSSISFVSFKFLKLEVQGSCSLLRSAVIINVRKCYGSCET